MHVVGLPLHRVIDRDEEVVRVRGRVRRDVTLDTPARTCSIRACWKGLHLEEAALGDSVGDLLGALLADQIGDPRVRHHHLDRAILPPPRRGAGAG
jgi:hypothetical protein